MEGGVLSDIIALFLAGLIVYNGFKRIMQLKADNDERKRKALNQHNNK